MTTDQTIQRSQSNFHSTSARFKPNRNLKSQYYGLYCARLEELEKRILPQTMAWEGEHVDSIVHLEPSKLSIIIGTIYKDMPLKLNVLDEITREAWISAPPAKPKYTSPDDVIILEDMNGRVPLSGELLSSHILLTGMVVAVSGFEGSDGTFHVENICYPAYDIRPPPADTEEKLIAFCSGLNISRSTLLKYELLASYINGELGNEQNTLESSMITRMVICGNSLAEPDVEDIERRTKKNNFGTTVIEYDPQPLYELDSLLHNLSSSVFIDIMPGSNDPTSNLMPQAAMNKIMFSTACGFNSFNTVTNPYSFTVDGIEFLGTSGQNIDNMFLFTDSCDRLAMAEQTLRCAHIAPTAPDTILCQPFADTDPFIIDKLPHVYFIGNQPDFEFKEVEICNQKVLIILVPNFKETGQLVQLNLKNMTCKIVSFQE